MTDPNSEFLKELEEVMARDTKIRDLVLKAVWEASKVGSSEDTQQHKGAKLAKLVNETTGKIIDLI